MDFVHHSEQFLQVDGVRTSVITSRMRRANDALEWDTAVQREVRHAAKAPVAAVALSRAGWLPDLDTESIHGPSEG